MGLLVSIGSVEAISLKIDKFVTEAQGLYTTVVMQSTMSGGSHTIQNLNFYIMLL